MHDAKRFEEPTGESDYKENSEAQS